MRIVKSPYLRKFIAAVQSVPGYKPPAYDTVRTTLLSQAKERVEKQLQPWDARVPDTGVTICSDGWSDAQNRPLLNMLAVNPKGAKFMTAVDTSGEVKSGTYIAARIIECIEEMGPENVVQVSRPSSSNCRPLRYPACFLLSLTQHTEMSPQAWQSCSDATC